MKYQRANASGLCAPAGAGDPWKMGGAFVLGCPPESVAVKPGTWTAAVPVGNGVKEAMGERGVLNCSSREVFVGDASAGRVE